MTNPRPRPLYRDFNHLPLPLRESLLTRLLARNDSGPLLRNPVYSWWWFVVAGLLVLLIAARVLVYDPALSFAREPAMGIIVVILAALGAVLLLLGLGRRQRLLRSDLPQGHFLFTRHLVTTQGGRLRIQPLAHLIRLSGTHQHLHGMYIGTQFTFRFPWGNSGMAVAGRDKAEDLLRHLANVGAAFAEAARDNDRDRLAALILADPFFEVAAATELPDADTHASPRCLPLGALHLHWWRAWAMGCVVAFVVAVAVIPLRDLVCDNLTFAHLTAERPQSSVRWNGYLDQWSHHADAVRNQWLPRAALDEAKRANTVTALRDFRATYPKAPSAFHDEAKAAIAALYAQSLANYHHAAQVSPAVAAFMDQLFAWLIAHDAPTLQVRFLTPDAAGLADMDAALAASDTKIPTAPAAPVFTANRLRAFQSEIIGHLNQGFGQVCPADVIHVGPGPDLSTMDDRIDAPTVCVHLTISPSGEAYHDQGNTRQYVGITADFRIAFRLPGETDPLGMEMEVQPPHEFRVQSDEHLNGVPYDQIVYATMAARAFDELDQRLRHELLDAKPKEDAPDDAQPAAPAVPGSL